MAVCGGDGGFGFLPADEARIKSRDDWTIYCEIQSIQNAILNSIANCGYSVIVDDNTPMTETNTIEELIVNEGGSGYFDVNAIAKFVHLVGTGATADVVITGGQITQISVTNGGSGYEPIVALSDMSNIGDGNAYLAPKVMYGEIVSVQVVTAGTNYTVGDTVAIIHPVGYGAEAEVSQVGASGNILAVKVNAGGYLYDDIVAEIEIEHPYGDGFMGTVSVASGVVTEVDINSGGLFYNTVRPEVMIDDDVGDGFVGIVNTDNGVVVGIDVINGGSRYSDESMPIVVPAIGTFGSGAVLEISTGECAGCKPCATGHCPKYTSSDYFMVYSGAIEDRVIEDQLDAVTSYFTKLGYTIRAMTNPTTGDTMQWSVSW